MKLWTILVLLGFLAVGGTACKETDNPPAGDEEIGSSADSDEQAESSLDGGDVEPDEAAEDEAGSGGTEWKNVGQVWTLSPEELHNMLKTKDFLLLNVYHGDEGNIPGTDAHLPHTDMDAVMTYIGDDKNRKTVLYCFRGLMSVNACDTLVNAGYTHVACLDGGLEAWEGAGYDVED